MSASCVVVWLAIAAGLLAAQPSMVTFLGDPMIVVTGDGTCDMDKEYTLLNTTYDEKQRLASLDDITKRLFELKPKCSGGFALVFEMPKQPGVALAAARCCTEHVPWWRRILFPRFSVVAVQEAVNMASAFFPELMHDVQTVDMSVWRES